MLTKAEKILLDGVRSGDSHTWSQFVERYQGRLLSYAVRALNGRRSDAEDLVQEVFIAFIKSVDTFEGRSSLESWLFMILRRRMIDMFRKKSRDKLCLISDISSQDDSDGSGAEYVNNCQVDDMTASQYVRKDENANELKDILSEGLFNFIESIKEKRNFRDLKVIELLFYAGLGNKQTAQQLSLDANTVGVIRHRSLDKLRQQVLSKVSEVDLELSDGLLRSIWIQRRFTCPKRSTIGSWHLGSLDEQWSDYVKFHIDVMGCTICKANLDDIQNDLTEKQNAKVLSQRFYESSIGFLN